MHTQNSHVNMILYICLIDPSLAWDKIALILQSFLFNLPNFTWFEVLTSWLNCSDAIPQGTLRDITFFSCPGHLVTVFLSCPAPFFITLIFRQGWYQNNLTHTLPNTVKNLL